MKRVAILGKLQTKYNAPFKEDVDIWTMNLHRDHSLIPRITCCFDLHKVPQNPNADILKKDFRFDLCKQLVGGNYFNNTVSYLIAYAILQEYEEILLYGMKFTCDHERRHGEFQNVQNLISFALGTGIPVHAPCDSVMLTNINFPIQQVTPTGNTVTITPFKRGVRINVVKQCIQELSKGNNVHIQSNNTYSNLVFYAKGLGLTVTTNTPILEFPSYENVNGKDFDWF